MPPLPKLTAPASPRIDDGRVTSLRVTLQRYLDLMYNCDLSRSTTCSRLRCNCTAFGMAQCSARLAVYRDMVGKRQSPKSLGARREDSLLLLDFASPTQALTKVRVHIANLMFVDYLTWHRIDDKWLITSKGFHLEAA